jgi:hypothetical protein
MNAITPAQKEESDPIKIEPTNATTIEMIEIIANIVPDAITTACIGPRLWFKIPHPRIIEAIKRIMMPVVIWAPSIIYEGT